MKKINLKNILKKTFKSKSKKIVKPQKKKIKYPYLKVKTVKNKKKLISLKKKKQIKIPKIKKETKNNIIENKKNDGLRISKSNEQKPEIIKIKKQQTEKKRI